MKLHIQRVVSPPKISMELPLRQAYDLASEFYDRRDWMQFWRLNEKPRVLELLGSIGGKRILDIGCGTGFYGIDLIKQGAILCGVDLSLGMIEQFRHKLRSLPEGEQNRAALACADAREMPVRSSLFETCIIIRTLSHCEQVEDLGRGISRVLKQSASLVIADLHNEHDYEATILEGPGSDVQIRVTTYKRSPQFYIRVFEKWGFKLEKYDEVAFGDCRPNGFGTEEFQELAQHQKTPVFFLARLNKLR